MTFNWTLDERKFLPLEKGKKLLKFCRQEKRKAMKEEKILGIRDWFMVELGLNTGLRVQEMADLKCGDLFISGLEGSLIVRRGKGKKRRAVLIAEPFKKSCQFFLRCKHHFGHSVEDAAPVLTSEQGRQLTKRTLQKSFKRVAAGAGLENHYSIHCLRHTYGTYIFEITRDLRFVQEQLGHSSVQVTEIYAGLLETGKRTALSKFYGLWS